MVLMFLLYKEGVTPVEFEGVTACLGLRNESRNQGLFRPNRTFLGLCLDAHGATNGESEIDGTAHGIPILGTCNVPHMNGTAQHVHLSVTISECHICWDLCVCCECEERKLKTK